jgi:hypothetical protein
MKLRWRGFERSMRRRVYKEMHATRWLRLKSQLKRSKRNETPIRAGVTRWVVLLLGTMSAISGSHPANQLVSIILLWFGVSVFWRASQLQKSLYYRAPLEVLLHLPISDADIFRLRWRAFLRLSVWSVVDFAVGYGILAAKVGYGEWGVFLAGLGLGLAQWLMIVSAAACLTAWRPRGRFYKVSFVVVACALVVAFAGWRQPMLVAWVADLARWVPLLGWSTYALGINPGHGLIGDLWPALTTGLLALALPRAYQKLKGNYRLGEPASATVPEKARAPAAAALLGEAEGEGNPHAALKETIRRREFLMGFDWQKAGLMERLGSNWLTPEEKLTAEFLCAGKPQWTSGLRKNALICAGLFAIACLYPAILQSGPGMIFLVFYVPALLLNQPWRGTSLINAGEASPPLYSVYPLGFRQMAGVMLKANLLRLLLLPLFGAAAYWVGTRQMGQGAAAMVEYYELKVAGILVGLVPVFTLLQLSSGTNDTQKSKPAGLSVLTVVVLGGCGLAFFFTNVPWLALALFVAFCLISTGVLVLYGHAYNHCWFDLQSRPKETKMPAAQ